MDQQSSIFPLKFTLERVKNGYVLKALDEQAGMTTEPQYIKEVVTDDKIDARIGHLLQLDTMKPELPITFYVEAATEHTYKTDEEAQKPTEQMTAKVKFYQYKQTQYKGDLILVLHIQESGTLELYGASAEKLALNNNIQLIRVDGIHMLRFPDSKEGKKQLGSYRPPVTLLEVSEKEILNWYKSHDLQHIADK